MTGNRAFIDKINEAWAKGDTAYLLASVTDDVRFEMVGGDAAEGKDAFAKMFAANAGAPAPRITVTDIIAHGASAVVEGTMDMADQSGEVRHYAFCDIYRLSSAENGKIRSLTSYMLEVTRRP
jgi:ketosteroid isomerase-like protein